MTDVLMFILSAMQVIGMIAGGICFLGLLAGGDKQICFPVFILSIGLILLSGWLTPMLI